MGSIVIAFPKQENGRKIREILSQYGYEICSVCTTAAAALNCMQGLESGVLITGYKLSDMYFTELRECMPASFEMLILASGRILEQIDSDGIVTVEMPASAGYLAGTVEMILAGQEKRHKKQKKKKLLTLQEKKILEQAKQILMEKNHMTEDEAHRYIQKCSMDSGTNMIETAEMIILMW